MHYENLPYRLTRDDACPMLWHAFDIEGREVDQIFVSIDPSIRPALWHNFSEGTLFDPGSFDSIASLWERYSRIVGKGKRGDAALKAVEDWRRSVTWFARGRLPASPFQGRTTVADHGRMVAA
jgi:hypothetical protein